MRIIKSSSKTRFDILMDICPEYRDAVSNFRYNKFQRDNPNLENACHIFNVCHGTVRELDEELELLDEGEAYNIGEVIANLVELFSKAGETECTMYAMRWGKDNGYSASQRSFRL